MPTMWRRAASALLVVLAGCSDSSETPSASRPAAGPDPAHPNSGVPRVASGVVLADETLWAMGPAARARTVAVSALVDDPLYSAVAERWDPALPRLSPNPEQLVALGPSAVILAGFSHPEYRVAAADRARVVMLDSFDSFDDYRVNVGRIGEAAGLPAEATALIEAFETRRAALLSERTEDDATWPTCLSWISGYVAAAGTTFDDISEHAGCHNLATRRGLEGHAPLEVEQLLAWEPDVLIVQCPAEGCAAALDRLRALPGLGSVGAVAEGRVVPIEGRALLSTGIGMLDAVDQLRRGLAALPRD